MDMSRKGSVLRDFQPLEARYGMSLRAAKISENMPVPDPDPRRYPFLLQATSSSDDGGTIRYVSKLCPGAEAVQSSRPP